MPTKNVSSWQARASLSNHRTHSSKGVVSVAWDWSNELPPITPSKTRKEVVSFRGVKAVRKENK